MDLGTVDNVQPTGVRLRNHVSFAFAPGDTFMVLERDGYGAIIHKQLPLDVTSEGTDISLATFSTASGEVLASRGVMLPRWIADARTRHSGAFVDEDHIVAVSTSTRYFIGAIAALPLLHVDERTRAAALVLVPVGLLAGIALATAVLYLARLRWPCQRCSRARCGAGSSLAYQPIVDLRTGRWIGAEALIRWIRPGGEMVRPDLFIPVAEDSGLIHRITERVMELASSDAAGLSASDIRSSIWRSICRPTICMPPTRSACCVGWRRLPALALATWMIEATERGFVQPALASEILEQIRQMGIEIAIDDFGTGYSSLSLLARVPAGSISRSTRHSCEQSAPRRPPVRSSTTSSGSRKRCGSI